MILDITISGTVNSIDTKIVLYGYDDSGLKLAISTSGIKYSPSAEIFQSTSLNTVTLPTYADFVTDTAPFGFLEVTHGTYTNVCINLARIEKLEAIDSSNTTVRFDKYNSVNVNMSLSALETAINDALGIDLSAYLTTAVAATTYQAITKYGRANYSGGVCYTIPGVVLTATSSIASVINTIVYDMFWVESEIVLDQMALNVTTGPTGTAKMHIGIYNADTDWQPSGAALVDNTITVSGGATGVVTQSISLTLPRGRYLIARNCNNTFTMRSWRGYPMNVGLEPALASSNIISSGSVASAYGALPSSTPWTAVLTGGDHPILLRVSTP